MGKIIWLASYPKSGNTWLRTFLTNLWGKQEEPADINQLDDRPIASSRYLFDEAMGIEASDLTATEIELYRPAVYEHMTTTSEQTLFMKTHDAYTYNQAGRPLLSRSATQGVIYLIRNPLDVAISYAHHSAITLDEAITWMGTAKQCLCRSRHGISNQLRQRLLTWSEHVVSWIDEPNLPLQVVRYEDMVADPVATFTAIVRFAGLPDDPQQIERAIAFSRFEVLQSQEYQRGFGEKPLGMQSFFRRGQPGEWRERLNPAQVQQIIHDHGPVMRRFGYLDEQMLPVDQAVCFSADQK